MNSTNEIVDNDIYEDALDYEIARRGKEFTSKDIERFFCVRNFIHAAYSNVVLVVVKIFCDNGVSDKELEKFEFHHGQEDIGDNHSETLEQFWNLKVVTKDKENWYNFWFPCKLFWMPRSVIREWFNGEDDGYPQILAFKEWMSRV